MHLFKPAKTIVTLLLGSVLVSLAACDQQPVPTPNADESITADTAMPVDASSATEAASESPTGVTGVVPVPVVDASGRGPAEPAPSRPTIRPTTGPTTAPPPPADTDEAGTPDPHAGHDMDSMSDPDMQQR